MVSITFYGGVGEVGGNKIFVRDGDTTVSLDFGMQMGEANNIWSEFQKPRKYNALGDLFEFNLLPRVSGLYRTDYTRHMQWKDDWNVADSVDAVVLSHAHVDHCEYLMYVRPSIPIYCSPESKIIMQGFDDMGSKEYMNIKESFVTYENNKGGLSYTSSSSTQRTNIPRKFVMIENHKKFKIGSMEFEPVHIDHSLPGTYAFIIYTSAGTIAYTADIRFHGSHPERSEDFVKTAAKKDIDLLLCEGTRLKPDNKTRLAETEPHVEKLVTERLSACKSLAVCGYPPRDLDRFMSFYNAAKAAGRKLAIDMRQAHTLQLFADDPVCREMYPSVDDENIAIFIPRRRSGLVGRTNGSDEYDLMRRDYDPWARDMIDFDNAINCVSMVDDHSSYALYLTDYTLVNLIDVRPKEGSVYIRSQTEPFNEEMELDHHKIKRWLVHFGLIKPDPKDVGAWDPIHVSGHGDSAQIASMVSQISPKRLVPIHTTTPELFEPLHDSVTQVRLGQTIEM